MNFPEKFTCPSDKLRTEFTSPKAKSTSPGLSDTTFFARWYVINKICDVIKNFHYYDYDDDDDYYYFILDSHVSSVATSVVILVAVIQLSAASLFSSSIHVVAVGVLTAPVVAVVDIHLTFSVLLSASVTPAAVVVVPVSL